MTTDTAAVLIVTRPRIAIASVNRAQNRLLSKYRGYPAHPETNPPGLVNFSCGRVSTNAPRSLHSKRVAGWGREGC